MGQLRIHTIERMLRLPEASRHLVNEYVATKFKSLSTKYAEAEPADILQECKLLSEYLVDQFEIARAFMSPLFRGDIRDQSPLGAARRHPPARRSGAAVAVPHRAVSQGPGAQRLIGL